MELMIQKLKIEVSILKQKLIEAELPHEIGTIDIDQHEGELSPSMLIKKPDIDSSLIKGEFEK